MITPIKFIKSGYNEVYYSQENESWCAQIMFKWKTYFLGSYEDIKDAAAARKKGEEMYDNFLEWYNSKTRDTNQD